LKFKVQTFQIQGSKHIAVQVQTLWWWWWFKLYDDDCMTKLIATCYI